MSLRLEMLQVARLSPQVLGEAVDLIIPFLRGQMNADGGFKDRAGASDLYYTVFGMEALMALGGDVPTEAIASYLRTRGSGEGLDLVHLGCLARCWANLPVSLRKEMPRQAIAARLEQHRSVDGGYNATPGAQRGTVYGCFLAVATYQDLEMPIPNPPAILGCLEKLHAADGGYANQDGMPMGLTPSTAAVATLQRQFGQTPRPELSDWLLSRCHARGGFYATPMAPIPDLLSTATALHALGGMHADIRKVKEPCLDFVDSLWTNAGSFYGNWTDDHLDCEYTYYALLALGHLSL